MTQNKYADLLSKYGASRRVQRIDDATPAVPTTEPKWWLEMMTMLRSLQS